MINFYSKAGFSKDDAYNDFMLNHAGELLESEVLVGNLIDHTLDKNTDELISHVLDNVNDVANLEELKSLLSKTYLNYQGKVSDEDLKLALTYLELSIYNFTILQDYPLDHSLLSITILRSDGDELVETAVTTAVTGCVAGAIGGGVGCAGGAAVGSMLGILGWGIKCLFD